MLLEDYEWLMDYFEADDEFIDPIYGYGIAATNALIFEARLNGENRTKILDTIYEDRAEATKLIFGMLTEKYFGDHYINEILVEYYTHPLDDTDIPDKIFRFPCREFAELTAEVAVEYLDARYIQSTFDLEEWLYDHSCPWDDDERPCFLKLIKKLK